MADDGDISAFYGDGDDPRSQLANFVSPTSASDLVGPLAPPPDSAPPSVPGQSTPRTGTLAMAPQQSVAKNLDTAQGQQAYSLHPAVQAAQANGGVQPSPLGGLARPSLQTRPSLAAGAPSQASALSAAQPMQAAGTQSLSPAQGSLQQPRKHGIWDTIGNILVPGAMRAASTTSLGEQRLAEVAQERAKNAASIEDIASQTQERQALGEKATALAAADAPITLTPEQAQQEGHPEWANVPLTQRTLGLLRTTAMKGKTAETVGAGHDTARVDTNAATNKARVDINAATNTSHETVAQARDKTQRLIADLRASTSRANNADTNASKMGGGKPDQTGHYKVPADVTKKAGLADNVKENADAMEAIIAKRPELIGKIGGTITSIEQMAGDNDGDIQELAQRAHNIALASNGAHGVRNVHDTAKTEDNILRGFRNGPAGIHGALQGLRGSVQTFLDDERNFRNTGGRVAPAASASTGGPSPSGKAVSLAAAKALPQNKGKSDDAIRQDIIAHGHRVKE